MTKFLRCAFAAVAMTLCAHQVLAQPMTGCPPGQAMQASSPSGKQLTCVPVPDMGTINAAIGAEAAARASADTALGARIDALTESDIIGTWATTGTTTCLQATNGFGQTNFAPLLPPTVPFNAVNILTGDFSGTTKFFAGNMGQSLGASHVLTSSTTLFGPPPPNFPTTGAASVASLDSGFKWTLQSDGKLTIDHQDPVVQPFTAPPALVGQTATIDRVPLFVGYLSKDKRTIVVSHDTMTLETSVRSATPPVTSPRFCSRTRVMTRIN